jgi:ATP-dependent Clp protease ATP-binding subunit ClpA
LAVFERFTERARGTVVLAQEEARDLHHPHIDTEHLLLGLLRDRTSVGYEALDRLGIRLDDVRSEVVRVAGEGHSVTLGERDAEALRVIGIDLDEVRRRIEEAFGAGALDKIASARRRRRGRRRVCGPSVGHIPFTPRAKKVLELALREAKALRHDYIGTEHILLGLVREREGLAAGMLAERDVSSERVRTVVSELLSGN